MRIVVALGGNALLRRGETPDADVQRRHLRKVGRDLAALADEHEVLVVHGNGPQVGLLALETEDDPTLSAPYPLGDLVAESQGLIGSWIQQTLAEEYCPTVAMVTQVVVDADDPAFASPSKPIGASYDEQTARIMAARHGWTVRPDGPAWRRVVASPAPRDVLNLDAARRLARDGYVVVLAGGGGVPIRRRPGADAEGRAGWEPVEAVVDKDLAAALVAERTSADLLVVLTDVDGVMDHFGTLGQTVITHATPDELDRRRFAEGSMAPKVAACSDFVRSARPDQHRRAVIGPLTRLLDVVAGSAGTQVTGLQSNRRVPVTAAAVS